MHPRLVQGVADGCPGEPGLDREPTQGGPGSVVPDDQALEHRRQVTAEKPSLPHTAGKAYRRIEGAAQLLQKELDKEPSQDPTKSVRVPRGSNYRIWVNAIARPEVDAGLLAEALLDHVESQVRKESA